MGPRTPGVIERALDILGEFECDAVVETYPEKVQIKTGTRRVTRRQECRYLPAQI